MTKLGKSLLVTVTLVAQTGCVCCRTYDPCVPSVCRKACQMAPAARNAPDDIRGTGAGAGKPMAPAPPPPVPQKDRSYPTTGGVQRLPMSHSVYR